MQRNLKRGLTMIEVLAATALFVIAFLVFMDVWPVNARAIALARNAQTAASLAQYALESTIYGGYAAAASSAPVVYSSSIAANGINGYDNGATVDATFTYTITVSAASPAPAGEKDVTVDVQWREGALVHHVTLETLLASLP